MQKIGIRHEDKSLWERRVPLVPEDVAALIAGDGVAISVQPSPTRCFGEGSFHHAGATIADNLDDCPIIMGVKKIPLDQILPGRTYVFFSHTIKGQPDRMAALQRLIDQGCTLIDYEKIVNEDGQRLVFFGLFAGLAGMIDTLWALGRRLDHEGIDNPFSAIHPAHAYDELADARLAISAVGDRIRTEGLPSQLCPFVCGLAGYGQVSRGAQEIYDLLPLTDVEPSELADLPTDPHTCYKVVFKEEHLARPTDDSRPFDLQEYYDHPERYEANFFQYAQHLTALVNCIYWEPKYPKLIDRDQFRALYAGGQPRLRVIGDITCDIDGSLACTTHATGPGDPIYVYDPATGETASGVAGGGPVVLAVDFLPAELPVDASRTFSQALRPFIPALANADFSVPLDQSGLPPELAGAVIVYRGELTESYRYLEKSLVQVVSRSD